MERRWRDRVGTNIAGSKGASSGITGIYIIYHNIRSVSIRELEQKNSPRNLSTIRYSNTPLRLYVQTFAQLQRYGRPCTDHARQATDLSIYAIAFRGLSHDIGQEGQKNVDDRTTRFHDERERAERLYDRARSVQPHLQHVQLGCEEFQLLCDRRRGGQQVLESRKQRKDQGRTRGQSNYRPQKSSREKDTPDRVFFFNLYDPIYFSPTVVQLYHCPTFTIFLTYQGIYYLSFFFFLLIYFFFRIIANLFIYREI